PWSPDFPPCPKAQRSPGRLQRLFYRPFKWPSEASAFSPQSQQYEAAQQDETEDAEGPPAARKERLCPDCCRRRCGLKPIGAGQPHGVGAGVHESDRWRIQLCRVRYAGVLAKRPLMAQRKLAGIAALALEADRDINGNGNGTVCRRRDPGANGWIQ